MCQIGFAVASLLTGVYFIWISAGANAAYGDEVNPTYILIGLIFFATPLLLSLAHVLSGGRRRWSWPLRVYVLFEACFGVLSFVPLVFYAAALALPVAFFSFFSVPRRRRGHAATTSAA